MSKRKHDGDAVGKHVPGRDIWPEKRTTEHPGAGSQVENITQSQAHHQP